MNKIEKVWKDIKVI